MLRAYKYRIYPTDEQKVLFAKTFGCCRFVYNWALNLKITAYKERKETLGNVYLTNLMDRIPMGFLFARNFIIATFVRGRSFVQREGGRE